MINTSFSVVDSIHKSVEALEQVANAEKDTEKIKQLSEVMTQLLSANSELLEQIKIVLVRNGVSLD